MFVLIVMSCLLLVADAHYLERLSFVFFGTAKDREYPIQNSERQNSQQKTSKQSKSQQCFKKIVLWQYMILWPLHPHGCTAEWVGGVLGGWPWGFPVPAEEGEGPSGGAPQLWAELWALNSGWTQAKSKAASTLAHDMWSKQKADLTVRQQRSHEHSFILIVLTCISNCKTWIDYKNCL